MSRFAAPRVLLSKATNYFYGFPRGICFILLEPIVKTYKQGRRGRGLSKEKQDSLGRERVGFAHQRSEALVLGMLLAFTCSAQELEHPNEQNQFDLNIPASNAAEALNTLAAQTDAILLFPYQDALSRQTNALQGQYNMSEALRVLLEGSGLQGSLSENGVIQISLLNDDRQSEELTWSGEEEVKKSFLEAVFGFFVSENRIPQEYSQEEENLSPEEIIVTGRKREETLQDIPVSVSVLGSNVLAEQNTLDQEDLADLVPGLYYNQGSASGQNNDRIAALPSIRGISSNEIATNRTKVSSFVDGMPILGSIGAINIGSATQVEVYSGPQSAAFGRSTFAGAINYVTSDPSEELEGSLGLNWSHQGTRIVSGSASGPLSESLGFHLAGQYEDSVSPDRDIYSYTDGVESGTRGGTNLSARFVFDPSDRFKAKLTFAHDATDDGPNETFFATQESTNACFQSLGNTFALDTGMGPLTIGIDGAFDCDLDLDTNANLLAVNDILRYYEKNGDEFDALIVDLVAAGAEEGVLGDSYTAEEAARIIAAAYSVPFEDVGSQSERDRVSLQLDYLFDSGSALQLSLMTSEEKYIRQNSPINDDVPLIIGYRPFSPALAESYTYAEGIRGRIATVADPTTIDEDYFELRWVSPSEERLRYVLGASLYEYEFITSIYREGGYGALVNGTADDFFSLTGTQVTPSSVLSEATENSALFFNASYDFTDTLTGSFEGRYSSDKVGAVGSGVTRFQTSNTFVPRIGLNWTPANDATYYFQYAVGVNPGGVSASLLDPSALSLLDNGVPVDLNQDGDFDDLDEDGYLSVSFDSEDYVTFDEEKLTNFELGFKGTALDNRLSYTGALYHMIWEDAVQTTRLDWDYSFANDELAGALVPGQTISLSDGSVIPAYYAPGTDNTNAQISTNSGTSETTGIELQARYQITDSWSVSGSTSLMKAEYVDYCSAEDYLGSPDDLGAYAGLGIGIDERSGNDCYVLDGKGLTRQPFFTLSLSQSYRTDLENGMRFSSTARVNHTGSQYNDVANVQKISALTTLNLTLGLARGAWSGTLYIENLLDDRTITDGDFFSAANYANRYGTANLDPSLYINLGGADYSNINYQINEGRSFGLRLNFNF